MTRALTYYHFQHIVLMQYLGTYGGASSGVHIEGDAHVVFHSCKRVWVGDMRSDQPRTFGVIYSLSRHCYVLACLFALFPEQEPGASTMELSKKSHGLMQRT